jgi:MFS family permease
LFHSLSLREGFALGVLTSGVAVGSFISLTVSAVVLEWFGWRMVFLIPSLILLFFTFLLLLGLRNFYFNMGDVGSIGFRRFLEIEWFSALHYRISAGNLVLKGFPTGCLHSFSRLKAFHYRMLD